MFLFLVFFLYPSRYFWLRLSGIRLVIALLDTRPRPTYLCALDNRHFKRLDTIDVQMNCNEQKQMFFLCDVCDNCAMIFLLTTHIKVYLCILLLKSYRVLASSIGEL